MSERNNHTMLWLPLAAGVVGAGLALLFAPRTGRETRQKLQMAASDLKGRADESMSSARDLIDSSIEDAKLLKQRLAKALGKASDEAKDEMDEMKPKGRGPGKSESSMLSSWDEEL